jgi:hypothetical protein
VANVIQFTFQHQQLFTHRHATNVVKNAMSPHTRKLAPTLGVKVLMDFQIFKEGV